MKYAAWIDFPSFSIAINRTPTGFRCTKFVENSIVRDAVQDCKSVAEVKTFLLSLPNPPKEQIEIAIDTLKLKSA